MISFIIKSQGRQLCKFTDEEMETTEVNLLMSKWLVKKIQ